MTLDELRTVLAWAADEGWNPGLDDAAAFYAADPSGFLVKEHAGAPVAAISVVNHDDDFAFLGLYLCKPEFRGRGYGMEVWQAGIAHAGNRCIGLDGVPDQQANYARSGFQRYGSTVRFEGRVMPASDPRVRPAAAADLPLLVEWDGKACGIDRRAFSAAWLSQSENRQTFVLVDGNAITGFATYRRCDVGTKIGPLLAASDTDTRALLASNPFSDAQSSVFIDVSSHGFALTDLLKDLGFTPGFQTARMFTGEPPNAHPASYHAIATMELG